MSHSSAQVLGCSRKENKGPGSVNMVLAHMLAEPYEVYVGIIRYLGRLSPDCYWFSSDDYLDPKSRYTNSPKPPNMVQQDSMLHTFGVKVLVFPKTWRLLCSCFGSIL